MAPNQEVPVCPGAVIEDRYEVLHQLGQGSFGGVYQARQRSTGQLVALKVLRPQPGADAVDSQARMEQFVREARLCAALSHPNIVRLVDLGEIAAGLPYVAFEFVRGATLKEVLATEGKLAVAEAVHLLAQVLDALSCAHTHGVVHRDIKPDNIMLTKTGVRRNAMVLDFGLGELVDERSRSLADIVAAQEVVGTLSYAAPEQLRGEAPSARSDLYSWGLTLLECVTGDLPFHGASTQEVILKQLGPEPVAMPEWLRRHPLGRVLEMVTAKQPEKREVAIGRLLDLLRGAGDEDRSDQTVEPERRQLTVVCCQLTLAAADSIRVEVDEVDRLQHIHHVALSEHATQAGGMLAATLADRALLVFGYPLAREGDARRAARCALAIARSVSSLAPSSGVRANIRIGVHSGLSILRDVGRGSVGACQVSGFAPQVASQLAQRAEPGAVLVSRETQRVLRHEFDTTAIDETTFRVDGERRGAVAERAPMVAESPLIGRAVQRQRLFDGWNAAVAGNSSVMLISGEPGIGKSRLMHELQAEVGPDAWVELVCAPEHQTAPLRPVIDALQNTEQSLESLLERAGVDVAITLPLLAALLSRPLDDRFERLQLTPERQKELTLQALIGLLLKMAEAQPIVLAIENLHWADATTMELVTQLLQTLRGGNGATSHPRLYVVVTTRPELIPPWSGDDVAFLPLQRLAQADVEAMVRASCAVEGELSPALIAQVIERAEGVPLFVEEVARVMMTSAGEAGPSGRPSAASVELPGSLLALLTARLDSVSPAARDTAQLAAVLGREFRYELLQAVSPKDRGFVRRDIAELGTAGLLVQRRTGAGDQYSFRHALLRDAAYDAMVRPLRQSLHRRVAGVLQQQFPEIDENRPEIVALHFEQGGENLSAGEYWRRAGDQALRLAEYVAADQQFERGLGLVPGAAQSPARARLEIELLTGLGTVQFMTKGYAAPEVEQTFARAWEQCDRSGDDVSVKVLYGVWSVYLTRGDREATAKLLPRFRLAAQSEDLVTRLTGHASLGVYAFDRGDFAEAHEHLASTRQFYGTDAFQSFTRQYGFDGGLYFHAYDMSAVWSLGYPDQADAIRRELQDIAERSRNPFSICIALAYGATLAHNRGEAELALELSDRLIGLAMEQHLYLWLAAATCGRGGALRLLGRVDEAVPTIQQGLAIYRGIGVMSAYSYYLTYLAAAHRDAGQIAEGLAVVDEGLSLCETMVQRFHESELLRIKGDLLALQDDHAGAESHYRRALDLAAKQGARSYELRAAVRLSQEYATQGQRTDALTCVSRTFDWFQEGFQTADLKSAATLRSHVIREG